MFAFTEKYCIYCRSAGGFEKDVFRVNAIMERWLTRRRFFGKCNLPEPVSKEVNAKCDLHWWKIVNAMLVNAVQHGQKVLSALNALKENELRSTRIN